MRTVSFDGTFEGWQRAARTALQAEFAPEEIIWVQADSAERNLDLFAPAIAVPDNGAPNVRVPRNFLAAAQTVACHSDAAKWPLLYRILWRLTHGEPRFLENPADRDTIELRSYERQVARDAYRMRQYVRFRETHLGEQPWFIAWYEPDHDSVHLNAEFFSERFANMSWSILTPRRCMHWNGSEIAYSAGAEKSEAPAEDEMEKLWVAYYSRIFNPARVKVRAMKAQMPVRNWKNLPEATVIAPLLREAPRRVDLMLERSDAKQVRASDYGLAQPPPTDSLGELREAAASCRACPLWKNATCTVFGEGSPKARIVLVGEQPGDQEDRARKPFVGPAGQMLDRALAATGIEREELYVTNAVKHFKWEPRGKRRIHQTPNSRDIAACRPWVQAELGVIRPQLVVALGRTATHSLLSAPARITEERGRVVDSPFGKTLITIHPSALLRLPDQANVEQEFERFVSDLRTIRDVVT